MDAQQKETKMKKATIVLIPGGVLVNRNNKVRKYWYKKIGWASNHRLLNLIEMCPQAIGRPVFFWPPQ